MSKKRRISESEFKIMLLEEREGALSETELLRLKSLKEQLEMQKKLGWVGGKVVSEKVFKRVSLQKELSNLRVDPQCRKQVPQTQTQKVFPHPF